MAGLPVKPLPLNVAERIWGAIAAILLGLAAAIVLWLAGPRDARADPVMFDCQQLAMAVALMADFRDTGADQEKVVTLAIKHNEDLAIPYREAIEREVRRLWMERKPKRDAVASVYRRCRKQGGDMGIGS